MTNRRTFLRTAGGMALGLPLLPSLLPRGVNAGGLESPKRFLALRSLSGQFVEDFWPTAPPAGYQDRGAVFGPSYADGTVGLHDTMPGTNHHWAPLSDFAGSELSTVLTDGFEPYYDKMLLLRGIDYLGGVSHGEGPTLGNYIHTTQNQAYIDAGLGALPTIDQVLAYSNKFYPDDPQTRSIVLSSGASTLTISQSNYGIDGGAVQAMQAQLEPLFLWEDLFGNFMEPGMPREHPNRRLVNAIYDDYTRLRDNSRMSAEDREKLERHMTFIDDIESDLSMTFGANCTRPDQPPFHNVMWPYWETATVTEFQQRVEQLVDITSVALMCDLTRVATMNLQMGVTDAAGAPDFSYHSDTDVAGDWHTFAHSVTQDPFARSHLNSLNRWCASIFRRFLVNLDVDEALGETFLDNSLVYFSGELAMDHFGFGLPTVLAGGAGGALTTGRYVDYTNFAHGYASNAESGAWGVIVPGIPHQRLLVTILQAMGLSPADYETPGVPGYGHSLVYGMPFGFPGDAWDLSDLGSPLPGIFNS